MIPNPKILVCISNFLPGEKLGGPIRSISSLIDSLRENFTFSILTTNTDFNDNRVYDNVPTNKWHYAGDYSVFYTDSNSRKFILLYKQLIASDASVIYLNSFFNFAFSIYVVLLSKLGFIGGKKIILAPRGELMPEALKINGLKKNLFIKIAIQLKIYNHVVWHATTELESNAIQKFFKNPKIRVARVLSDSAFIETDILKPIFKETVSNSLKVIFISRICRKKNLDFALRVLQKVSCTIEFDIYGPLEDDRYWNECQEIIRGMPANVCVRYLGVVAKKDVKTIIACYDVFFLPTKSENYGHVFNESLCVGTTILTSDRTPWSEINSQFWGKTLSLMDINLYVDALNDFAGRRNDEKVEIRENIAASYRSFQMNSGIVDENVRLFKF